MASNSKHKTSSRPLMLKDFLLLDDSTSRRSRPRSAIAALHKLLTSLKSYSSKKKQSPEKLIVPVTVKDILRLRSFRDENSPPLDSPDERWRCARNVGGEDPMNAGTGTLPCTSNDIVGPTKSERISNDEEEEQYSPVSVLHSPFEDEDDDSISSLDQSLANVERTKERLMESIKWLEGLAGVDSDNDEDEDDLLQEPKEANMKSYCLRGERPDPKANVGSMEGQDVTREVEECLREMEKEMQWTIRLEEETNQLGSELGLDVLNTLLDDIVFDLVVNHES